MKTWVWPFNWYCRIRELESEVAALQTQNRKLDLLVRSAALQQTSLASAYVASASSLASMMTSVLRERQKRSHDAAMAEYEAFRGRLLEEHRVAPRRGAPP